jgi:Glyoxalase-like domain
MERAAVEPGRERREPGRRVFSLPVALLLACLALAAAAQDVVGGLDHIPLAVRDLAQAQADFAALGFTLKAGRAHANRLSNAHIKFADGTEIELMAAPSATDSLARQYRAWLSDGDGPAFLGLYARDLQSLRERVAALGLLLESKCGLATFSAPAALPRLFFGSRQRSATDRPHHFAHANGAFSLAAAWLAGADAEQRLVASLVGMPRERPPCGPFGAAVAAYAVGEGELAFLPASAQLLPGRSIIAATVRVASLEGVRGVLTLNSIPYTVAPGCGRDSL